MIKKYIIFFVLFFLLSCGDISFVLDEDSKTNQYKDNVFVVFTGKPEERFQREVFLFFGNNKDGDYILTTSFFEKKENRLVKKNQVAEKIDYTITINYEVFNKQLACKTYENKVITKFSFVPKSFGYNFGTGRSLDKLYKNSIRKNINNFLSAPNVSVNACM